MDTAAEFVANVQVFETAARMFEQSSEMEAQAKSLRLQAENLRDSARCPVEERIYYAYQDVRWERCKLPAGHPEPCQFA